MQRGNCKGRERDERVGFEVFAQGRRKVGGENHAERRGGAGQKGRAGTQGGMGEGKKLRQGGGRVGTGSERHVVCTCVLHWEALL